MNNQEGPQRQHQGIKIHAHNPQQNQLMYQNQEVIEQLSKKVDRRIGIGYYCQVPSNSRHLIYPARKYSPSRSTPPKRRHPIKKKLKKADVPQMIDHQQNTSGEFILKMPDPIMEDNQMQWSIDLICQQVQYTLQSEVIECQDASIQYSFYQPPLDITERSMQCDEQIKQILAEQAVQSQKIIQSEYQLQYNEPLPEQKQQELQIDIPDQKQINHINQMEEKIGELKVDRQRQIKRNKKIKQNIQILKLKGEMMKLEKQIELTEAKGQLHKQKFSQKIQMGRKEERYQSQKKQLQGRYRNQANSQIQQFLAKIKSINQRPVIDPSYKEQERKRIQEEKRLEQLEKEELFGFRKDVQNLTQQLKSQMFKRLNYQNQSQDDTVEDISLRTKKKNGQKMLNSHHFTKQVSSMNELFPDLSPHKKNYVGSIIKNIPANPQQPKQYKINEHFDSVRLTKAYWRNKSSFNYQFNQDKDQRSNRKDFYLQKINKDLDHSNIELNSTNGQIQEFSHSSVSFGPLKYNFKQHLEGSNIQKYSKQIKNELTYNNLLRFKQKIDKFFANELYFRYLYGQTHKMIAGNELFSLFDIGLIERNSIEIYRFKTYFVFSYRKQNQTHFIVIYNDQKSMFYSKINNHQYQLQKLSKIYSCETRFKNCWGYQYGHPSQIYMGTFRNGKKEGQGIYISGQTYYQGNFKDNRKDGKGIVVMSNGDMYKGQFKNNLFNGQGVYLWANGQQYDGYFSQGLKSGYGKQWLLNGDKYLGFYLHHKKHGRGKYIWSDGSIYEGEFINDQKSGEGHLTKSDGIILVGTWKNDEFTKQWNESPIKLANRDELPLLHKKKCK